MSEELTRDPAFRDQYAGGVKEDAEFEAALAGSPQPRLSMPTVTQPLAQAMWLSPQGVRLR